MEETCDERAFDKALNEARAQQLAQVQAAQSANSQLQVVQSDRFNAELRIESLRQAVAVASIDPSAGSVANVAEHFYSFLSGKPNA